jgi:competence protein ComEC
MRLMAAPSSNPASSHSAEPPYQPLVVVLAAASLGIVADRFWPLPLGAWWAMAAGGLTAWAILARPALLGRRLHLTNATLLLAAAATAAAWHHCCWYLSADDDLGCFARRKAEPVCVEALAVKMPRRLPTPAFDPLRMMPPNEGSRLEVDLLAVRDGADWRPASGRATLLVQGAPPEVRAGDRVRCFAKLSMPQGPQNPGSFDQAAYLRSDGVRSRLLAKMPQCVTVVETGSLLGLARLLDRVRAHGDRLLERCLDPRRAELAAAVLLGLREEVDASRIEAFVTTGTIHILCISGLHMGILAGALFWIMRRMPIPRGWAGSAIAAITLLYALMVDAQPSVVRATVLVLVACGSLFLGRRTLGFNSLAAAALVVLALNPAHLFHVGAQLSFLCVAGLIWFATRRPHWDDSERTRERRTLERLVMANLGWLPRRMRQFKPSVIGLAQAGAVLWFLTFPLVMARFHVFSLVALIVNTLLWPLMSLSVLSGFGVLVFGTLYPPLGHLCGWLCDASFRLLEGGVNLAHRCSWGHFWVPGPADWWLAGFYGGLGLLAAFPRIRPPRRWCVALLAGWTAIGFAAATWRHESGRLDCTFVAVGHGCAVVLELPSGQTMLYDAGQLGTPSFGVRTISEFLWDRGLTRLDAVVLSHPDVDHYNALPGLMEKFSVGAVYVSPVMFENDNQALAALRTAIDGRGVPIREVRSGDRLAGGEGCMIEMLHPPRRGVLGTTNANSIVLAVEYQGRRILLPGDLES